MKASELRIGNYISLGPYIYDNWYEVDGEILAEFAKEDCDPYKPIPLTEEWLIKFGFEKQPRNLTFHQPFFSRKFVSDRDLPDEITIHPLDVGFEYRKSYKRVEYVHQLQNLYFALTGEELTIKE